jgi:hypothetical protein
MGLNLDDMMANNGLIEGGIVVAASDAHHSGGAMLPWEAPVGLVEARRRFNEDEDEEFEDYDFDEEDEDEEELEEDEEDEDVESLDEDDEDYDDVEEDFDEDGEPRSPKRRKEWE